MSNKLTYILKSSILLVAILLTGGAWAATPVAVWDGDLGTSVKTGTDGKTYTLTLPSGCESWIQNDGTLKIGSGNQSAYINLQDGGNYNLAQGTKISVLMEYENASAQTGAAPIYLQADAYFGLKTKASSLEVLGDFWGTTYPTAGTTITTMPSDGSILMVYPQGSGVVKVYSASTREGLSGASTGGDITGLSFSNKYLQKIGIGGTFTDGSSQGLKNFENLVIKKVAIFTSAITAVDAANYFFPSEIQTINVPSDTTVSAIKAQLDSENYKAIAVSAADGVTLTVDEAFGCIASVSSVGTVKLAAASQPAASYLSGVDFSGVQGALIRSWITSSGFGFNFRSANGSDVSGALVTTGDWIHDNNSASGTSTAMFADGLSTLTWSSGGTYSYSGSTMLNGYLDDGSNGGNGAVVKLSNVPYATYDVIIYASTDTSNAKFQAKTVNGTAYTVDSSGVVSAGNAVWGASRQDTPAYGTNAIRVKNLSGPLTIYGGLNTYYTNSGRGGIAAIQVINTAHEATISSAGEYTLAGLFTSVDSGDTYIINVNESATLNIDSATTVGGVTFNVASGKTLTLTGSSTLTAAVINVKGEGMVAMTSSVLRGTVKGNGTLYYNGVRPTTTGTDVSLTNDDWRGTVRITYNYLNTATSTARQLFPQFWGSANSKILWNGVAGYFGTSNQSLAGWVLEDLSVNDTTYPALRKNDGGSSSQTKAPFLEGSGEFADASNPSERFQFTTGANFTGKITITSSSSYGMNVQFGETAVGKVARTIHVLSGATVNVAAGKTWSAPGGIVVDGTLNVGAGSTIPAIVSGSAGVVQITSAGTATISGVKDNAISSSLVMVSGNLAVVDTGITELTIPAETGVTFFSMANGKLNLSGCTSLTTLKLNLGSGTTFDLANVTLPASCTTVLVDVGSARTLTGYTISNLGTATLGFSATETKEEYANGTFSVSNVPSGATVTVTRADGTTSNAPVTDGTARLADYGTVRISGAATDLDLTCDDESIAFDYASINASTWRDNAPVYTADGVYARANVYTQGDVGTFLVNNSAAMTLAVVGSMSPTANTIFLSLGGSGSGYNGIVLVRTANTDEVVIGYNEEGVVHKIAEMTVPNCATARHVYIITKEDDGANSIFTVYLDGIKWKTLTISKLTFVGGGVQVGADFHGGIRDVAQSEFGGAAFIAIPNNESETGVLNAMRVYGRVITPAEIAEYTSVFPYVSPNGSSARTFTAASENWIDETPGSEVWENSTGGNSGTPLTGAALNVTANVETEVTVNLASETTYEALTIGGAATTFVPGGNGGDVKVTGMTVIGTTVTNQYGAVDMSGGPMTITQDGDITFDYSAYDISAIYTTTDIPLTSDVDENGTKVHLIAPSAASRTVSLVYTSGHYAMRVTPDHEAGSDVYYTGGYWGSNPSEPFTVVNESGDATIVFPGDTVVIDGTHFAGSSAYFAGTLPTNVTAIRVDKNFTFESGVDNTAILGGATVTVSDGYTLSFGTSYHSLTLGAVTFNGPGDVSIPVTAFVSGAVTGTATLTIGGTVNVPSTGSIANAVTGAGRVVFEGALPAGSDLLTSLQDSSSWTGTVELKNYKQTTENDAHKIINLGNYGNSSSTVALNGVTSTMYTGNNTYPDVTLGAIEIGEGGWSDNDGLSYTVSPLYKANLTGHGTITVKTGNAGTVRFVGDNHTFNGSVAFGNSTGKQVAFMATSSDSLPSVTAKTIVVAGRTNMSIASGKTWTADAIKLDGSLTVLTAEKATATSVEPTAYLDGATLTTTVDGEAGTTTYVTDEVTQISDNQASLGAVTVSEPKLMTGSGGAYMSSLTINDGMTLTYDPVITPLRVESAPVFNGTGKLKLAPRYADVTCGKFHLVTYPSESFNEYSEEALKSLVDSSSFNNATYTVSEVKVSLTGKQEDLSVASTDLWQLVLKVGDYDNDAKDVSIAQFGDSITEGIWRNGNYTSDGNAYRGTPNYRIPLMQLLEAYGYKPEARGYREIGSMDANGVLADDNYKWHTGISAQRIYTGGSIRAGFMESIEAHLEQVGVTDIITLKIGTNDAKGNETADNMFEGWTNLVWKIVRMRPTSKIVVCAPIKIRDGTEYNAPGLREKIAEYMMKDPNQGGFPAGQVTLINGSPDGSNNYSGTEIIPDSDNYYMVGSTSVDRVHPNWNGHLRLANAWLPAVTNAIESMTARAADAYTAQTVASAESVAALADYRAGYVKLATFTNVFTKVSTWDEPPYTWVNDNFKNVEMSRVAYFVARKTKASPDTRYVWVDMDADSTTGTTLADFGVPTSASVNGVVNNLHIYSNSSAIENVAPTVSGVRGTLMRTEKGVNIGNGISTDLVPDGPYGFDWNDSINASGAWGVMNMARIFDGVTPTDHRKLLAAQMLFDFNGFNGGRQNALGLGNFAVHGPYLYGNGAVQNYNLNWTFTTDKDEMPTMDARALESGVIEIWGFVAMPNEGGTDAGYIDGTTAVITNTTSSVTVPAGATAVAVSFSTGDSIVLTSTSVDLTGSGKVTVYATDATGAKTTTNISAAFMVTDNGDDTYTVELNPGATVGEVSVTPEVDTEAATAPMAFDSTAPVFTIKTIPGLWYTVASGADLESLSNGNPEQADEASETLTAPTFTGTVQYYKVTVAPSKAALVETPPAQE